MAVDYVYGIVHRHKRTAGSSLLDVACGTGMYLVHLQDRYGVVGLDIEPSMIEVAHQKLPAVELYEADMATFDLGRQFDVVLCLGSSIGYAVTPERMRQAVGNFARHALPGGVVIVEPWFVPAAWDAGRLTADLVDQPSLKIARVLVSGLADRVSTLDIHYLVARPEGVDHFTEHHRLGLFTHEEYLMAFREANLDVTHDPGGPLGRGLYIGVRSRASHA